MLKKGCQESTSIVLLGDAYSLVLLTVLKNYKYRIPAPYICDGESPRLTALHGHIFARRPTNWPFLCVVCYLRLFFGSIFSSTAPPNIPKLPPA
jgi:hypothetical protein